LLLEPDLEQPTPHEHFRLLADTCGFVLQAEIRGVWRPLYWFDLHEQLDVDFEVFNHFVATHPASSFHTVLTAARAIEGRRLGLRGNRYSVHRSDGESVQREIETPAALRDVLAGDFGIVLPESPRLAGILAAAVSA
jgi:N-hydroxyarylamine O-acetyltransferase